MPILAPPPLGRRRKSRNERDRKGSLVLVGVDRDSEGMIETYDLVLLDSAYAQNQAGLGSVFYSTVRVSGIIPAYTDCTRVAFHKTDEGLHYATFERLDEPTDEQVSTIYTNLLFEKGNLPFDEASARAHELFRDKEYMVRAIVSQHYRTHVFNRVRQGKEFERAPADIPDVKDRLCLAAAEKNDAKSFFNFIRDLFTSDDLQGYRTIKKSDRLKPEHRRLV